MMQGMLDMNPQELAMLANSWINPPKLENVIGCSGSYNQEQRAYVIQAQKQKISFTIAASTSNPLHNAAFVLKGWNSNKNASLKFNGEEQPIKQGIIRDTNGSKTLVIWVEILSRQPIDIVIQ